MLTLVYILTLLFFIGIIFSIWKIIYDTRAFKSLEDYQYIIEVILSQFRESIENMIGDLSRTVISAVSKQMAETFATRDQVKDLKSTIECLKQQIQSLSEQSSQNAERQDKQQDNDG
ncbi:MAG TPA: hypothetical protein EYN51_06335 [Flavobacteriales bacterium]|nr:hypothetical protein [Flavobacteriales bacterium]